MRVLAKILEDLFRAGERVFGVDYPALAVQRVFQLTEALCVRELRTRAPQVGDKQLKGIDLIRFDEVGTICEFEVMVRTMSGFAALAAEMATRVAPAQAAGVIQNPAGVAPSNG
ncbi:MAG TPA: hypothetical protein VHN14_22430 [Kofleriaceae bacterium]|jgi:hypothetical protein|nr:hypothetical protein [Kofleriaceae bacterium]